MIYFPRKKRRAATEPTALGVAEEALALLRHAPPSVLARYYLAAIPFAVGAVLYWVHMARHPLAEENLSWGALALVALFSWMKLGQAAFARDLRAHLMQTAPPRWGLRGAWHAAVTQTILHATGLVVYPAAIVLFFPLPYVYGAYQNLTVLEDGTARPVRQALAEAVAECRRWHGHHALLLWFASPGTFVLTGAFFLMLIPVLSGLDAQGMDAIASAGLGILAAAMLLILSPSACLVAVNGVGLLMLAVNLAEGFAGVDAPLFSMPQSLFNTTGFAVLTAAVFLLMDPVAKAAYVVRCHHGRSVSTGEDLRLRLRRIAPRTGVVLLLCAAGLAATASAQETGAPAAENTVGAAALEAAIATELEQPHFLWREGGPRNTGDGWFSRHLRAPIERAWRAVRDSIRYVFDKVGDFLDWVFDRQMPVPEGSLLSFRGVARTALVVLAAVLAVVLAWFLYRTWRVRRAAAVDAAATVPLAPRLEDENTLADELPEDAWVDLAREMAAKGDFRLAARALFLALLARLSEHGYIRIARHKSNRDYARELHTRALAQGDGVEAAFHDSTRVYEAVWYGDHEARPEHVDRLRQHQERLRAHA